MYWVLAYDVVENRARSRFFRHLKKLMIPTQKSVFEGVLDARGLLKVERLVTTDLDLVCDSVRVYPLCATCLEHIRVLGTGRPPVDFDEPVVL